MLGNLLWRLIVSSSKISSRKNRQSRGFVPRLEGLEDRLVPASTTWTAATNLDWENGGNWTNGVPGANDAAVFTSGATVSACHINSAVTISAITMLSGWGNGVIEFAGSAASLTITGGSSTWDAGTIEFDEGTGGSGSGSMTLDGSMNIDPPSGGVSLNGGFNKSGTLTNNGIMLLKGTNPLNLDFNATLDNAGTLSLTANCNISTGPLASGSLVNSGTVAKSGGTGTSVIKGGFDNIGTNAKLEVDSGKLLIEPTESGASTGGTFTVATGATLAFACTSESTFAGSYGYFDTGVGRVLFTNTLEVGAGGASFNIPGARLQFQNLTVIVTNGDLTNNGTLYFNSGYLDVTSSNPAGTGNLVNNQSMIETSTGTLNLLNNTSLSNTLKGIYDLHGDGGISTVNSGSVVNTGLLRKSTGTGTSFISCNLNNTGRVEVHSGTLNANCTITQVSSGTLTAGSWSIFQPTTGVSTLTFGEAGNVTTLGSKAIVTLNGVNIAFPNIASLTTILAGGSLTLLNGQSFTTAGSFTNKGRLTLTPGTVFTVSGNFTQTSTATLIVQFTGTTPTVGKLVTTGTVSLGNSKLTLQPIGSTAPPLDSPFTILDDGSSSGINGIFSGLPEGTTISLGGSHYTISYVGGDGNDVALTLVS
jgi:hypothetical protein